MTRHSFLISIILSVIGMGIAAYLTWVHYNMGALVCGNGGCEIVQTSIYATMAGVPIAMFGLAMYVTDLAFGVLRVRRPEFEVQLTMAMLAITFAGTIFSGWLTWIQLFEIQAICQWCLGSAGVTAMLFLNEIANVRRLWIDDDHLPIDTELLPELEEM